MYKLYVGTYMEEGTPATWTICGQVPRKHLQKQVEEIVKNLRPGMELYIMNDEGEIKPYFRELCKIKK